jgi:hypothetical protein
MELNLKVTLTLTLTAVRLLFPVPDPHPVKPTNAARVFKVSKKPALLNLLSALPDAQLLIPKHQAEVLT